MCLFILFYFLTTILYDKFLFPAKTTQVKYVLFQFNELRSKLDYLKLLIMNIRGPKNELVYRYKCKIT